MATKAVAKRNKKVESVVKELFNNDQDLALFFAAWVENERNATKAMLQIRPSLAYGTAATLGGRMLKKVEKDLVLSAYGLGIDTWMQQLSDGLGANKQIAAMVIGKDEDSKTTDFIEVPDHAVRKPYHDKLGKLLGLEGEERGVPVTVNILNHLQNQKDAYS